MSNTRVKIASIVQSQLPDFVREEYPLVSEFLKEYYNSLEVSGGTLDVLQNIDRYVKIDELTKSLSGRIITVRIQDPQSFFTISGGFSVNELIVFKNGTRLLLNTDYFVFSSTELSLVEECINGDILEFYIQTPSTTFLKSEVGFTDDVINVESTYGFPESNGIIKIDSEIILYKSKTETSFVDCKRGFSGITSYRTENTTDQLTFSTSQVENHENNSSVENLSLLLLKEFLLKIKKQLTPGFENKTFVDGVNQSTFIKQVKDFYSSKGTEDSYQVIFKALFGENIEILRPRDYLFKPSDANYRITRDLVVESVSGDPMSLLNRTLYQDESGSEESQFFSKAYGTITRVEKIQRLNKNYYVLSLDADYSKDLTVDGTVYGNFKIHPSTKLTTNADLNSAVLTVDSTIGFPKTGELTYSVNGQEYINSYIIENITQFSLFGTTDVEIPKGTDIKINNFAYSEFGGNIVKVRITGVISDVSFDKNNYLMSKGETFKVNTLGYPAKGVLANNWIFNIANKFKVKQIIGPKSSNASLNLFSYEVITIDKNNFYIGDIVKLISSDGNINDYTIRGINNENSVSIEGPSIGNLNLKFLIERSIVKPKFTNFDYINQYSANVQNVYIPNSNENAGIFVASNSLPNYLNENIDIKNPDIVFSGTFGGEILDLSSGNPNNYHGLYTGDSVIYKDTNTSDLRNNLGILSKVYYVEKVDNTRIKLANSKLDLFKKRYVSIENNVSVTNNIFSKNKIKFSTFSSQNFIKNISKPVNGKKFETPVGPVGIFVNGVEAFSYKSEDKVYYGGIDKINVIDGGDDYDVINPPNIEILDENGSNATAYVQVTGELNSIDIIDPGFDYISDPIVTISGGNGSGAVAKVNLTSFRHKVSFNSIESSLFVNLSTNTIGFSTYHKFRDNEQVIYLPNGQTPVGGLTSKAQYYVNVQDSFNIRLHKTLNDSVSGINTINLTSYGVGVHEFEATSIKRKISSFSIIDRGSNYSNKKTSCFSSGVSTTSNIINIPEHGYKTGEILKYTSTSLPIGGLENGKSYYAIKVNDNQFRLSEVGIGSTSKDFYFRTNQTVNLTSIGSSEHIFNYEDIVVSVDGIVGVSTRTGQDFNAVIQPIFRGSISKVFVNNSGVGYGSSEIINYERQPNVVLGIGTGAQLSPIVNNGRITQVLVLNGGSNYNSPPDISIFGNSTTASLVPVISNGRIVDVKVQNSGVGFSTIGTSLEVFTPGNGFKYDCKIKSWTINKVEKNLNSNKILEDDGVLDRYQGTQKGLQYCHFYAPRKLRRSVFGTDFVNGKKVLIQDLNIVRNVEVRSKAHSPIIGWAYDGNPIYGPYGFSSPSGGVVREMKPGYIQKISEDRPDPISESAGRIYPPGFFVEDYQFNNSSDSDLDEHNGRFCITPEFPEGTYAYFATISDGSTETSGIFKNYKKPVFPYLVGNTFNSIPNTQNYQINFTSQQNSSIFSEFSLLRNTSPYNLSSENSQYDFVFNPLKIKEPLIKIESTLLSGIDDVEITSGGTGYKVGDKAIFDNTNTSGSDAYARVSFLEGKEVTSISCASTTYNDVEFYPINSGSFVAFSTIPHNFLNNDIVSIGGLSTSTQFLNAVLQIGVRSDTLTLSKNVDAPSATGIVTYFDVNGSLDFPKIRENDIYELDTEKIKILSVDKLSSRIKVLREFDSSVGTSHTISTVLFEKTRKFTFSIEKDPKINFNLNKEIYFNPKESVSLGTGSTLSFSNPGAGITIISTPAKTIYLPNHKLETGNELIYSTNGGSPIFVSDDNITSFQLLDNQIVYAAKVSEDLIGISTNLVGLGSTGSFVGIDSSITTSILFFTNVGSGDNHSFKTNYSNSLTGEVTKNVVTVSTAETHGLKVNDIVFFEALPGITTTVVVKYNDKNSRLLINPKSFTSSDVDITNNIIFIKNHGYSTGEKVVYTAESSPIGGVSNNEIYYIVRFSKDKIKLSSSYYNSIKNIPEVIDFTSASDGTLSLVNPRIFAVSNQFIKFDLSDESLSYSIESVPYPAFEFVLYKDSNFTEEFIKVEDSEISRLNVTKVGRIGVDENASVTLRTENLDFDLYYRLVPVDLENNSFLKKNIIVDDQNIIENNKILLGKSGYFGFHLLSSVQDSSFNFNIFSFPEIDSYSKFDGNFVYSTNSKNAVGGIKELEITSRGRYYDTSPGISSVFSENGKNAILDPISSSIGKITNFEIEDIGFNYPADQTLYPSAKLPQIIKVNPLSRFKNIGVSSVGIDYSISPDLIVIDSTTNNVVNDVELNYDVETNTVKIIRNTEGIFNSKPTILPVNNSNGVPIKEITFDEISKNVTIELDKSYSFGQVFPFNVGDKVLVENVNIDIDSGKGFNSKEYGYKLFTLTSVNPLFGGTGANIVYNLSQDLLDSEVPGSFDSNNSAGIVTPEKYFPIFDPVLEKFSFLRGEVAKTQSQRGIVLNWNKNVELLKLSTSDDFELNSIIVGESSNAKGIITRIDSNFDAVYNIESSAIVKKGWELETGFLNNQFQVIADNDYYQNFSYSIKSKVDYDTWNDSIGNLNHTSGFKKFGDLVVESIDSISSGISTDQNEGDFSGLVEFVREIDLNCVNDFDLVRERTLNINSQLFSKEFVFNSRSLQDEFISIGNRVLSIDDIGNRFSSEQSSQIFSIVDTFRLTDFRSKKYITYVKDKNSTELRESSLVTLIHDNNEVFLNEYSGLNTGTDLGSFEFSIFSVEGTLRYFPNNFTSDDYTINVISYGIKDDNTGIGSTSIGNLVDLRSSTTIIPSGTSSQTNIVGIGSTYSTSKVLVQFTSSDETYYQFEEITLLSDGNNVSILEYGQLSNATRVGYSTGGIGTYSAYISGSTINLDFTPNVSLATTYIVNTLRVSIASTNVGITTSSLEFNTCEISSNFVAISSSPSPTQIGISTFSTDYESSYYIVSVEDVTNGDYQASEILVINDGSNAYISEFGGIGTSSGLGTFGANYDVISGTTLNFTPIADASINVKIYRNALRVVDTGNDFTSLNLTNANIESDFSEFDGVSNSIRKSFDLLHRGVPIFQRSFQSSDPNIVNIENNRIKITNNFYVGGEELKYDFGQGDPVGIETTTIAGIGLTDKLPSTVYVIKLNDVSIRLASSPENSLKPVPEPLIINSVGVGIHTFTSTRQNARCLITIDNHIQSPIVSTAVTTTLASGSSSSEEQITISDITSIFSGDLLKINDEIIRVNSVGVGSTNSLLVDRGFVGTNAESHSIGSTVTKVLGNYNIVNNTINFADAPYGNTPTSDETNRPDQRDYIGITTRSTFGGRVFLRSGINTTSGVFVDTYSTNYVLDSLSDQFDGVTKEFVLKSSGQDVTGISTSNAIVLINNVFQEPKRTGSVSIVGNYEISENAGISTIEFIGGISSASYDINNSSIPRGGVIVSVASTTGFGYQPLISAGGTSIVSSAGTISNISVGYSGSGYRSLEKYEIITKTSSTISSGSTIIYIDNQNGIFEKLAYSSSNSIGIGSQNVPILGIGNSYVLIGSGSTISQSIESEKSVLVSLNSPYVGLVDVGVKTSSNGILNYEFIGFATVIPGTGNISSNINITNPGSGYTSANPPIVVFDGPNNYDNIPLIYSSGSSGLGTEATVNIIVGQNSSVIDFELENLGYGYNTSQILTVPTGGLTGIPTDASKPFINFELTIDEIFSDIFYGWSIGDLQVIDKIENLFDGVRRNFPIKINGIQSSIRSRTGSNVEIQYTLLIFLNDILQVPDVSYTFNGGSTFTFLDAPNVGDTCKILFYKGTGNVDVLSEDVLQTIKIGDLVRVTSDIAEQNQNNRLITDIISSDLLITNPYTGAGLFEDETILRPLLWCRQTEDLIISGQEIGKDREIYEPLIQPATNIIQNVGSASTEIFVQSVKIFFDDFRENTSQTLKSEIILISQDPQEGSYATANVSTSGTISSLNLVEGGIGFTTDPVVKISNPVGFGSTSTAIASISSGIVTSLTIINPGSGYTTSNPPQVLIEYPKVIVEEIVDVDYEGDFGIVVGVSTTSVGVASTAVVFDLFIPTESYLRNTNINVGIATTGISGIKTDYYFTIFNSNIGFGLTSLDSTNNIVGVGTSCLDNVYKASSVSIAQTSVLGIGITDVTRVVVSVLDYNGLVGYGYSGFYGEFSWGRLSNFIRKNPLNFNSYNTNGISGLNTSTLVQRLNPLSYIGYSTTL
jgi:hypothetical protein